MGVREGEDVRDGVEGRGGKDVRDGGRGGEDVRDGGEGREGCERWG